MSRNPGQWSSQTGPPDSTQVLRDGPQTDPAGAGDSPMEGIRQSGAILHAKALSATAVKPVGSATGNGEASRRRIRTLIALQNHAAQIYCCNSTGSRAFCDTPTEG